MKTASRGRCLLEEDEIVKRKCLLEGEETRTKVDISQKPIYWEMDLSWQPVHSS